MFDASGNQVKWNYQAYYKKGFNFRDGTDSLTIIDVTKTETFEKCFTSTLAAPTNWGYGFVANGESISFQIVENNEEIQFYPNLGGIFTNTDTGSCKLRTFGLQLRHTNGTAQPYVPSLVGKLPAGNDIVSFHLDVAYQRTMSYHHHTQFEFAFNFGTGLIINSRVCLNYRILWTSPE